ncbi:MAG: DNA-3-methyladenine glycosylase I, partial [Aliivibrio sp.]|nr:DNA-3-methyladenine glycosylase I [Aliivibrio sp.]
MTIEKFESIYQRAAQRKGGNAQLELMLHKPLSPEELAAIPDDRWLAVFTEKVFQCGISWNVVRKKWPEFEEVFFQFRIQPLLLQPDETWEEKAKDPRIIRHLTKVMTIPANALMINMASLRYGSFGQMVAN